MENVYTIAEYTLWYCDVKLKKPICNLKLQKYLYYMQGVSFLCSEEPLFSNEIEAWKYGPVVPEIYYNYNMHLTDGIKMSHEPKEDISERAFAIIKKVCDKFNDIPAIDLVERTYKEEPWKDSYMEGTREDIPKEKIKEFFRSHGKRKE
ncbi:MAG: Panacea domain-containing protein [Clostridium sp.]